MGEANENEYTDKNGVNYVALMRRGCRGCAFDSDNVQCDVPDDAPSCKPLSRTGGESIIWVVKQ